jgi:hypothetical protein
MQSRLNLPVTATEPLAGSATLITPADGDPRRMHATTLLTFDLDFAGDELWAAANYFDELPVDELNPDIRAAIIQSRNRIKDYVDESERWLLETGGSEDTETRLIISRDNLALVWYLVGRVAEKSGDLDTAITEWTDLYPRLTEIIALDWELAVAHATRAGVPGQGPAGRQGDTERAVHYLQRYVEFFRAENEPVPWEQISSEPAFTSVSDNPEFRDMLRGRQ